MSRRVVIPTRVKGHRIKGREEKGRTRYCPRDAQRVVSQKSNWGESVLHCSHVCIRQREPFLTPNRGKAELIGWGRGRQSSCQTHSNTWVGQRLGPRPMMLFMTLPPYTRTSKGEVHELGLGVRNCSHRALSDPLSEKSESIERACEDTSAEGTARCASRGNSVRFDKHCPLEWINL